MTKEATVSVRLTAREKSGLDADARMKGIPSGTAAAGYIAEGVRRSRFPAIEFRDGQPGRVAYLVQCNLDIGHATDKLDSWRPND